MYYQNRVKITFDPVHHLILSYYFCKTAYIRYFGKFRKLVQFSTSGYFLFPMKSENHNVFLQFSTCCASNEDCVFHLYLQPFVFVSLLTNY